MASILFVCLGNICRSPTAEGLLRKQAAEAGLAGIVVDSAGTGDWHVGHPPDRRAIAAAKRRGTEISHLRARQVERDDFYRFDFIIAMDRSNYRALEALAPPDASAQLSMMLDFSSHHQGDVPDPYFGGTDGFEAVLDMLETANRGLIAHLRAKMRS